eukprot:SAG31_NODE_3502_length_4189_cov_4.930073_1_plen_148_part_00
MVKLVGEPQKNVDEAVRAEHCDIPNGFGASKTKLISGNYGVAFTPEHEYRFVADPDFIELMSCGVECISQRPPIPGGFRKPVDIRELSDPEVAVARIKKCFRTMGWNESGITVPAFKDLNLSTVELISMRMLQKPSAKLWDEARIQP